MAIFDTSRTAYGASPANGRITAFMSAIFGSVIAWNDARVTRNALSGLTDRELEDIGLIRGDIETVTQSDLIR